MHNLLDTLSIHFVGNKNLDNRLILSESSLEVNEELSELISTAFFERFNTAFDEYAFSHPSSLEYNEIYNYVKNIFEGEVEVHDSSTKIASWLYEQTNHPKIKDGELYVVKFTNCVYNGAYMDAIGIFKTEVKNDFVEIFYTTGVFDLMHKKGIDLKKIEKGCVVYNTNKEEGYSVRVFDNQNKGNEAHYWKEDFLGLKPLANEFKQTNEILGITKEFISKQVQEEFEVSKTDKIDLLNRSVDYFKTHEEFTKEEFEQEVFGENDELIESFQNFDNNYRTTNDIELEDNFEISTQAVKKQERSFKSVLKLDKNFHIYIHGDRNKIEQGVEEDGRKFYKVYFDTEE